MPSNNPPILNGLDSPASFAENTVNATPQLIDASVSFSDPDSSSYDDYTLTVSGLLPEDIIAIRNQGTGTGQIAVSGNSVLYDSESIGTFSGGNGSTLTVTFNSGASAASITAVIENLTYANSSDAPTATRTITITVTDPNGVQTLRPVYSEAAGTANPFDGLNAVFAGSSTAPVLVDIDGDGDLDLVVGSSHGTLRYAENTGSASAPNFVERTGAASPFNGIDIGVYSSPAFADFDGDGDLDAITGDLHGNVFYLKNTGTTGSPAFTLQAGSENPFDGVNVSSYSKPSMADLDGDGDLDVVMGADTVIKYFENTGPNTAPVFIERTGGDNPFNGTGPFRFVGITFADLDGDGDLDAIAGRSTSNKIDYYENTGSVSAPVFVERTGVQNPLEGFNVPQDNTPFLADLDGDGDFDVITGKNNGNILTYLNTPAAGVQIAITVTAENDAPRLTGLSGTLTFAENTVNATPQLIDADVSFTDGDNNFDGGTLKVSGLLDADVVAFRSQGTGTGQIGISGNSISYGGTLIGTFTGGNGTTLVVTFNGDATAAAIEALIENLTFAHTSDLPLEWRRLSIVVTDAAGATTAVPNFVAQGEGDSAFASIGPGFDAKPTFADLDGDGDLDAVAGARDGTLIYYKNIGTNTAPAFLKQTGPSSPFYGFDVGSSAAPSLGDMDGDGDLDLVVGTHAGTQQYYFENTGTATAPSFEARPGVTSLFLGIAFGSDSTPTLVDLDNDGDLDLVIGREFSDIGYYENTGTAANSSFVQRTGGDNPFAGFHPDFFTAPTFADVDGDGDLDLVVGGYTGAIKYFENTGTPASPSFVGRTGGANPFNGIDIGASSAPTLADIDGDGDLDLIVGGENGELTIFYNAPGRVDIEITRENDAPKLTGLASSVTFSENTVNAAPQLLDADVTFTDGDNYFGSGSLTVSGLLAEDKVAVRNQGTGSGQIGVSGNTITYGGVVIGSFTGGTGTTLTVAFNLYATPEAVDALIQNLTYANASDTPTTTRTLTLTVTDEAGAAVTDFSKPTFTEVTGTDNPFDGFVVTASSFAGGSTPIFADLDGDGDFDLVAGSFYGALNFYENTGSATAPVYVERTGAANPFNGIDVGAYATPAFADIDGDGDLDLLVGDVNVGYLTFFENDGDASAPHYVQKSGSDSPFSSTGLLGSPAPAFADLDGDGDLDLIVGKGTAFLYFENTGNAAAAVFIERTGAANPLDGLSVVDSALPTFVDVDGDGDLDLVSGSNESGLFYFENTGTALAPAFIERTGSANPFSGISDIWTAPAFADIDGDGDIDLVIGNYDGEFLTFINTTGPHKITVTVTQSADTITGTPKADTLSGTGGDDIIRGLGGNDTLRGNGGNDSIYGGAGSDRMTGGAGADTFFFTALTDSGAGFSGFINNVTMSVLSGLGKRDIITDFTPGTDKIDLSAIDANKHLANDQGFMFLGNNKSFTHKAAQLIARQYNVAGTANDKTIIYGDVNGDGRADFQIELTGIKTLATTDFVL